MVSSFRKEAEVETVANIIGTPAPDKLLGTAGSDTIAGLGGNDTLSGLGDRDLIYGRGGNDDIFGNAGDDTLYGGAGDDYIAGGDQDDLIYGGAETTTLSQITSSIREQHRLRWWRDDVCFNGAAPVPLPLLRAHRSNRMRRSPPPPWGTRCRTAAPTSSRASPFSFSKAKLAGLDVPMPSFRDWRDGGRVRLPRPEPIPSAR